MKAQTFYLCRIEKEKRTRIKISFEKSLAMAIFVTCHPPKSAGLPFTWEITTASWQTEVEGERNIVEQMLSTYQKEEMRNFKVAISEATKYNKRLIKEKKLSDETQAPRPRFIGYTPIISTEEIIKKVVSFKESRS